MTDTFLEGARGHFHGSPSMSPAPSGSGMWTNPIRMIARAGSSSSDVDANAEDLHAHASDASIDAAPSRPRHVGQISHFAWATARVNAGSKAFDKARRFSIDAVPDFVHSALSSITPGSASHSNSSSRHDLLEAIESPVAMAFTLRPFSHRENTGLHALRDTFSVYRQSLPGLPHPHLHFKGVSAESLPGSGLVSRFMHSSSIMKDEPSSMDERDAVPTTTTDFNGLKGDVLVMGGYRGSTLKDAKTKTVLWVNPRIGMGFGKPDLFMGLGDEDELRSAETVVPGKMLMRMSFINLGKGLETKLKLLAASTNDTETALRYHNHGYDWRRNLDLSSAELLEKLEHLKAESALRGEGVDGKGEGATIIAHSMGGLVTLHALAIAKDPTVIKQIIFAGTPFGGCANILGPLRQGDGILFNKEIGSPVTVFSMRSSFYLLPRDHLSFETPAGKLLPIDFFDAHSWAKYGLSPLMAQIYNTDDPEHSYQRSRARAEALEVDTMSVHSGLAMVPGEVDVISLSHEEVGRHVHIDFGEEGTPSNSSTPSGTRQGSVRSAATSAPMSPTNSNGRVSPPGLASATPASRPEISTGSNHSDSGTRTPGGGVSGKKKGGRATPFETEMNRLLESDSDISEYLERTLERVKKFYHDIDTLYDPAKAALYPKIALITSRKTATARGIVADSYDTISSTPYTRLLFGEGDGIVTYESASSLPGQWNTLVKGVVESNFGHVSLLADIDSVAKCFDALRLDK
ncbi:BQ2448_7069 [Microbotryum intermedium]|uniref:BQ2448_7069 protein n=1 Tax=Microbotryum intermedium TaxID=269621 RepID=A0A238FMP0_9BASI|nr:BQ2448_7069 [Microbotryum intermedium]